VNRLLEIKTAKKAHGLMCTCDVYWK